MFVASSLYHYATGTSSSGSAGGSGNSKAPSSPAGKLDPKNSRVKRHPKKPSSSGAGARKPYRTRASGDTILEEEEGEDTEGGKPSSPPPSYDSVAGNAPPPPPPPAASNSRSAATGTAPQQSTGDAAKDAARRAKLAVIDEILAQDDLYKLLNVGRKAKTDEIRRGFLNRSRLCHPDKFPDYPPSTMAFQKVSFAYETLSKPSSRRIYDVSGRTDFAASMNAANAADGPGTGPGGVGVNEETLNGVLYSVFCEFMEGDFEMVRVLVNALNEGNPGLDLGEDAVENLEGAFKRLRAVVLAGKKYLSIIRFELIRLYEIQHSLRQLSYFDVFGRLRLTLQLARVTLSIPMAIDQAMREPGEEGGASNDAGAAAAERSSGEEEGASTPKDASQEEDDDDSESDSSDDSDGGPQQAARSSARRRAGRSRRHHRHDEPADFGMAPDEPESDDDSESERREREEKERRRARKAMHRAQQRAKRRGHLEQATEDEAERGSSSAGAGTGSGRSTRRGGASTPSTSSSKAGDTQRRGLLGPTGRGLLSGVVTLLETSEKWVPGGGKKLDDD